MGNKSPREVKEDRFYRKHAGEMYVDEMAELTKRSERYVRWRCESLGVEVLERSERKREHPLQKNVLRGSAALKATINEATAAAIYTDSGTIREIAERRGASASIVESIRRGESWKHVTAGLTLGETIRVRPGRKNKTAEPAKKVVRKGAPPLSRSGGAPKGFVRVNRGRCADEDCANVVSFVHRELRVCYACALKAGLIEAPTKPLHDSNAFEQRQSASEADIEARIATANRMRDELEACRRTDAQLSQHPEYASFTNYEKNARPGE